MKKLASLVICALKIINIIIAAGYTCPIGGKSAGIGNASVTFKDFWSIHNNQAGLAVYKSVAAGLYYENRFLLKETSLQAGGFIFPTNSGVFGLSITRYGYSNYNENKIGLAYGRSFGKNFNLGVQLDYLSTNIPEPYGKNSSITFEMGMQSNLSENLVLGVHVFNPFGVKQRNQERIPTLFKLGIAYAVSEGLRINLETEKNMDFRPLIRGGVEYELSEQAKIRVGYSTLPAISGSEDLNISSIFTFGFGLHYNKLEFDFSTSIHQTLGSSPHVSFVYNFN